MTVLCLGEAIVDLVCEREVGSISEADGFVPHFGGAMANVAVAASRTGAQAALAGGAGEDAWGAWLRDRLEAEGVDVSFFSLVDDVATPVAFVTLDHRHEPSFQIYGDGIEAGIRSLRGRLEEAISAASALVIASNTLVGERERQLTTRARELALEEGVAVVFDPNIRDHRWADPRLADSLCRELCEGAFLVRANYEEGHRLAAMGEEAGAAECAEAICSLGAELAVVTRGADGAMMRGASKGEQPGVPVDAVSAMGAGDCFTGTLVAGLSRRSWDAARAAEALPDAVEAAARVCTSWGAID